MTPDTNTAVSQPGKNPTRSFRLKAAVAVMTGLGVALFSFFVYSVGLTEIIDNIRRFGLFGFAVILVIFFLRIVFRAAAWKLSVYEPYSLKMRDTIPAVVIGEVMSSMIPMGIIVSGTAKAVAVRRRVPLVVGLSSVATENLFYSVTTSVLLILGALTFVRTFDLDPEWALLIDLFIVAIICGVLFLFLMVLRQWHFASETCEWLYRRGILTGILDRGRMQVRLFENLVYGFYRRHPGRFLPICIFEAGFHLLGIIEVWFVLSRIAGSGATILNAFMLESVSRLISIVFKLIPFLIGVDEAGAQFVAETVGIGAGIGVTLAIIRKGRVLFWVAIGITLIVRRGLRFSGLLRPSE
ncbi:MAG TPA: lysylphosphatidylglycerol synthase transmembrane domain-containing protein [Pyrinomonadaceae bacterium]|nr:lysylphosphatidylglycerol synthase transmembrane domain-containing protein [Pyrinomonadaceae bacterium]HMP64618.1 lysylphosphatidylglycerol synthase transmembrane domain-containing protein [Pyrinomonadaceae bacterium]